MELVKKGGVKVDEKAPGHEGHKDAPPAKERTIYVCDVHPEEVFDKPGRCKKES